MRESFGANDVSTPVIRFIVVWGRHENDDGSLFTQKLDRSIELARQNGFRVQLTLTGATTNLDCAPEYNTALGNGRGCVGGTQGNPARVNPMGVDPSPAGFAEFVRKVAERYRNQVSAYGIWNEPNNSQFLKAGNTRHASTTDLYRRLYDAAYNRLDGLGVRVHLGELSSFAASVRLPSDSRRSNVTPLRFFKLVVQSAQGEEPFIRTHGVTWHPYQYIQGPYSDGPKSQTGIGKTDEIQDQIDDRWFEDPPGPAERLLATPSGARPDLFFTEFGYFNDQKTEAERARLHRQALSRAQDQGVRWMVFYQATEISPLEYQALENAPPVDGLPGYRREYGLFSPKGEVTGMRSYGKGPNPNPGANAQARRAFCGIHTWAALRGYEPSPESPCEG